LAPQFFFSSSRRHTRFSRDWSSDVCSSDLKHLNIVASWGSDFSHFYLGVKCKQDNFNSYTQNLVMDKFKNKFPWEKIITREYSRSEERRVGKECKPRWS